MSRSLSIVAAVNDDRVLNANLARSPAVTSGAVELICCRGAKSASLAYQWGAAQTQSDYVVFAHQDVYLPSSWLAKLTTAIERLEALDPAWALAGTYGVAEDGSHAGQVWSTGLRRLVGTRPEQPVPAVSFDELAFVWKRSAGDLFDSRLPSFHLYGTDTVQTARLRGHTAYIADIPCIHNSRPVRNLAGGYSQAYRYMQRKWRGALPLQTTVLPVTRWGLPLLKRNLKTVLKRGLSQARGEASALDAAEIARTLGYE